MFVAAIAIAAAGNTAASPYHTWTECLRSGAAAMSAGPDSAGDVTKAVFILCSDAELSARSDPGQVLEEDKWQKNRRRLEETTFAAIILRRAERATSAPKANE